MSYVRVPASTGEDPVGTRRSDGSSRVRPSPQAGPWVPVLLMQRAVGNAATCTQIQRSCGGTVQPLVVQRVPTGEPELFPTYEGWLQELGGLPTFQAQDAVRNDAAQPAARRLTPAEVAAGARPAVLGEGAATDATAPQPVGPGLAGPTGDHFIDHPTDEWVRAHLPPQLRETAYQLPTDCADIAVVLRHVWLSAHHRTESYSGWLIGDRAGGAAQARIRRVIGQVYSGNVASMLSPYLGAGGDAVRDYASLRTLIHPGDILVWAHHDRLGGRRTGGHTQTIARVDRDGTIFALQGNQPLNEEQAETIRTTVGPGAPSVGRLTSAQARRIEMDAVAAEDRRDLPEPQRGGGTRPVWTWADGSTTLVAAGPPLSAPRTASRRGISTARLTDWSSAFRVARPSEVAGVFELALAEFRAVVEAGGAVAAVDAERLGTAAGEALWRAARAARDLGQESHFLALRTMHAAVTAMATASRLRHPSFQTLDAALDRAARGMTGVSFSRPGRREVRKVLVTGFDPFNTADARLPPRPGDWNPSAAAALALDGATLPSPAGPVAVEGVVLPVSFAAFDAGLVESVVRPLASSVDAVVTVSQDPTLPPHSPVRLERFVVGARDDFHSLGPVPGGGAPIDESTVPAARVVHRAGPGQATVGQSVELGFPDGIAAGRRALAQLGSSAAVTSTVPNAANGNSRALAVVDEPEAIQRLMQLGRAAGGTRLVLPGQPLATTVTVIEGPGGNYLSNEVSFRALRTLRQESSAAVSVHVHTPRGTTDEGGTLRSGPDLATALSLARDVRAEVIARLRRIIPAIVAETRTH